VARPRFNQDHILVGVGGSVSPTCRARIYAAAKVEGTSVSGYIGRVLEDYAQTLPALRMEADPRQLSLLAERFEGREKPTEVVGFGEGHILTPGTLAVKVKSGRRIARER
jgi:hypothetical protein